MKKAIITARSFGKTDQRAYEMLWNEGFEVKKIEQTDGSVVDELKREIKDADILIAGLERIDKDMILSARKLKVISRYGVGYDNIDLKTAKECGVQVTITPGANGDSVADLAMGLMLDAARNITVMSESVKAGKQIRPQGVELYKKTVGIIGTGRIGQGVGKRCRGFDMRILAYDIYPDSGFQKEMGAAYVDLNTLLRESDFITIHAALTNETKNLLSTEQFSIMKHNAILINTARGGIVDEEALYQALRAGKIRGAALDATVHEPLYDSPLMECGNCILTPHAGAATAEASANMSMMAAQNAIDVFHGIQSVYNVAI